MMSHSHDSTTPLIGNGRLLQGQKQELMYQTQQQQQAKQQQQQYTPQQHHLHDPHKAKHMVIVDASPGETSPFYQEEALAEVSGGGGGTLPYQQRSKVAYVPVYQHQHQHQGDWAGMGEGAWSSGTPAGSSGVGMGVGLGLGAEQQQQQQQQPSTNSPLDPYGIVDPRRHSAYLRPLDTLPPQVTHLPTHLSDHQLSRQTQPQPPFTTPTHPHHLSSTPHSPASSSSAASTLFKASSEHESSV